MIDISLTKALRDKIKEIVADYKLPVKNGEPRCPTVVNGYLPPKRSGVQDDFPFILVRPEEGKVNREDTITTVSIIICCFSEEYDGYEYCVEVMTRIKTALCSMENNILADKYVLTFPIEWDMILEQPYPYWQLDMITKWAYNTPLCNF